MTSSKQGIRVAIHIESPGVAGGTAQSTQGLIHSLGALEGRSDMSSEPRPRSRRRGSRRF